MKKIQASVSLLSTVVLVSIFALSACSSTDNTPTSSALASANTKASPSAAIKEPTKAIEVTIMTWESPSMNDKIMASMKKFEAANPGITVKLIPAPLSDYGLKINQMIAANQGPDIFMTGNDMVIANGAEGRLYDWSAKAAGDKEFMDSFYNGVLDAWKQDGGKLYGLPGLLNTYGYFYNKKLFKDAGLTEPKAGWTYDEMFADALKLTSKKGGVQQYGLYATVDPFKLSLYSVSAGGAPFADGIVKPTKVEISPQFIEGLEKYKVAIANGSMIPPTFDQTNVMSNFKAGTVAMTQQGQWIADDLIRTAPNLDWGFVPGPVVSSQTEIYDAVGWSSPSNIKNPDAIWKVLKYMDSTMYAEVLPQNPVAPAAQKDAAKAYFDFLTSSNHADVANGVNHILQSKNVQPVRFLTTWAGKANPFIDAAWNNILTGKAPVSSLNDMVDKITKVIK
ncbi:sugar ABC transporter substrate-binding protein [Paenibacillus alginolyticus]|uniref:ABC transporter substrate-binding protein n=1 Tax=Paenibacillus alginolyticus TaxID=59839 RepID=UPI000424BC97|nr:sugar ABC transporter substrate-binding protein [Paenibacillus alginolyticus]MCY9663440.1 sugar ABC transporter substrate-binding protein [Paenibacillus alginolyticus]